MKIKKRPRIFNLDNSGIIHLANLRTGKSNIFRLAVALNDAVRPEVLQEALNTVTPRFPTLVAGIRDSISRYLVVSVNTPPEVQPDRRPLAFMPLREIRKCAMRVLYSEKEIAVEFFHSLTDGHGGFVFFKAMLAEYFKQLYGVECTDSGEIPVPEQMPMKEETTDSFLTYAGEKKAAFNAVQSYLPGEHMPESPLHITTGIFEVQDLLGASHRFGVSLTTFLTAVMAKSLMEVQTLHQKIGEKLKPVQIMVPINLRRKFPSKTLRNFSLYALPCVRHGDMKLPFEKFVRRIDNQLREQFTEEQLKAMMATNVQLDRNWFLRMLPLAVKCTALRIGSHFLGERNSSLTLSNLGDMKFPKEMQRYINNVRVFLSARTRSPYNCGAVSYNGRLYFNFSRNGSIPELEPVFFRNLCAMGCVPRVEVNGKPENVENYLGVSW